MINKGKLLGKFAAFKLLLSFNSVSLLLKIQPKEQAPKMKMFNNNMLFEAFETQLFPCRLKILQWWQPSLQGLVKIYPKSMIFYADRSV